MTTRERLAIRRKAIQSMNEAARNMTTPAGELQDPETLRKLIAHIYAGHVRVVSSHVASESSIHTISLDDEDWNVIAAIGEVEMAKWKSGV